MQKSVRDNNQVLGRKLVADRRDQQRIKLFQMGLRSLQQRLFQPLDIVRAQPEFCQLQLQQTELLPHFGYAAQGDNLESLA